LLAWRAPPLRPELSGPQCKQFCSSHDCWISVNVNILPRCVSELQDPLAVGETIVMSCSVIVAVFTLRMNASPSNRTGFDFSE